MALRFFDTNFYKSPFVRGLQGACKGLYSFIICDCKASGIWAKDLEVASLYIGFKITEKDFDVFLKLGKAIDLKDGNYFFPDFIEHQYPKGLSDKNPAHINIILDLKKYNLIDENLKPLTSPLKGTKVMVMVKEKETVKETETKIEKTPLEVKFEEFLKFRKAKKVPVLPESVDALKSKLWKLSNKNEDTAIEILNESIANGYQGIFELKNNNGKQSVLNNNKSVREEILTRDFNSLLNGNS
jgi:hypothetical protein